MPQLEIERPPPKIREVISILWCKLNLLRFQAMFFSQKQCMATLIINYARQKYDHSLRPSFYCLCCDKIIPLKKLW